MITLETAISFIAVAIALTIMPGPDILFVIAQSMSRSARSGVMVALGLCTGLLVHTSLAALGISAVVLSSKAAFTAVKWLGAAYLLYLAYRTWPRTKLDDAPAGPAADKEVYRHTAIAATAINTRNEVDHKQEVLSLSTLYRRGIWMNVLNPKVSLFFLALLPQFVSTSKGNVPFQMIQFGLLFICQALVVFCAASIVAGWLGGSIGRRSNKWNKRLSIIEALIYAALAANLVLLQF
ncbi:threonine/homoserine/homoserine lactone efflux protein [Paenibacillus cellulosilyticus]|uniref:Threonine/homoserine/homoserine lactone efflux protein n=1 Tax=Paenibacillus cellulosilyticus TaxID=375489 RepID=A0A2V2Z0F7_9BACL|nr:LysE family translocator [Paenibacillus cellulosilyticus]PWW06515.1 threonine/homoserine/homoserine lactone efflux protein [Paenibacillus cellulosilyticus]QKS46147.1 LysE family translocator [Paenibacillus cellulosilyticus]